MRAIYCAGEQGRVTLDILRVAAEADDVVFIDDDASKHGGAVDGIDVIGGLQTLDGLDQEVRCIVAFGDCRGVRLELAASVRRAGYGFFEAVHPNATLSGGVNLGVGVTVNGATYIGPNAVIDDHVLIDSCVNVSHDVSIAQGSIVTPGATIVGGVDVGRDAYIGPGATILEDLIVGDGAVVGAGAVVTEDVPGRTTVVGVPASPVEE